jgi:hypothetical protein
VLPIERLMAAIPSMIETITGAVVFEDCVLFWDRFLWRTSVRGPKDRGEVYTPAA